jgi:tRNA (adenine57-N1/adenine58-N1)-methyltransferase
MVQTRSHHDKGTGSGSFSHSIVRSIGPSGHLWTYEFHEVRANKARFVSVPAIRVLCFVTQSLDREEFALHGMDQIVTLTHRNVCKEGFTVVDTADSGA